MNKSTLREVIVPLVSLVVLVILGWLAYGLITGDRVTPLTPSDTVSPNGRANLGADEPSAILPGDLPLPEDASITESFEVARKGELQGTRSYQSSRSLQEELAAYRDYVEENGWTVIELKQDAANPNYAALLSGRDDRQLLVSFSAASGVTSVTATAFTAPANY